MGELHMRQPPFDVLDGQHVAVPDHIFDVVEGNPSRVKAVGDGNLIEASCVLLARDALLVDGAYDFAVLQQACADVMIIRINSEDVGRLSDHSACSCDGLGIDDNGLNRNKNLSSACKGIA